MQSCKGKKFNESLMLLVKKNVIHHVNVYSQMRTTPSAVSNWNGNPKNLETKSHCQIKFHSQHTWDTSSNSVVIFFLNVIVTKHIDPLL